MDVKRILVPVSGSASDEQAIELACLVARKTNARIFGLYVIKVARALPLDADVESSSNAGEQVLARAEKIAAAAGCSIETDLLQSRELGSAVVDEAIERAADLIIIGVLDERKFGEFDLGSTAAYVLENAPCRVWVCREPSEAR